MAFDLIAADLEYFFGKHPQILGCEWVLRQITMHQTGDDQGLVPIPFLLERITIRLFTQPDLVQCKGSGARMGLSRKTPAAAS